MSRTYKEINNKADELADKGQYDEAIHLYIESINLAEQQGKSRTAERYKKELQDSLDKRAREINETADQLFKEENYEKALKKYEQAWQLIQKAGSGLIMDRRRKSFRKELLDAKESYCEHVIEEKIQQKKKENQWVAAADKFEEILEKIPAELDPNLNAKYLEKQKDFFKEWAKYLNDQADRAMKEDKFEEAVKNYSKAVNLYRKSGHKWKLGNFERELEKALKERAKEVNHMGDELMEQGNYEEAVNLYESSVDLAEKAENNFLLKRYSKELEKAYKNYAQQVNDRADELVEQAKFKEAIDLYQKSIELAKLGNHDRRVKRFAKEKTETYEDWAKNLNNSGDLAMKNEEWSKAANLYKNSLEVAKNTLNQKTVQNYMEEYVKALGKLSDQLHNIGKKQLKQDKKEKAFDTLDKAVQLAKEIKDQKRINDFSQTRNNAL